MFEGDVRVPFIVRGPGIKPNSFSNVPVVGCDLMPTFLKLIDLGFAVPEITEGVAWSPFSKTGARARSNDRMTSSYSTIPTASGLRRLP